MTTLHPVLSAEDLAFGYGKSLLFEHLSFSLGEGEILSVLGPNGAGKTTLLRCLMGMLKPKSGIVRVFGEDVRAMKEKALFENVAYVPQNREVPRSYSVMETVLLGLTGTMGIFSEPGKKELDRAEQTLDRLGILSLAGKPMSDLSGGEVQMVLLARALVKDPKILILDEPESGLDFRNQLIVLNTMDKLKAKGISCIFNIHYPKHALQKADCSLILGGDKPYFGKTDETVNEKTIEAVFGVRAVISEMQVDGEIIKNIVPLYVTEKRG